MSVRGRARSLCLALAAVSGAAALAGCGSTSESSGLSAADRNAAQAAMNALQHTGIPRQLVEVTRAARLAPAACRVHPESGSSNTFKVYIFWVPYIGPATYTWLHMSIGKDVRQDTFHLGAAEPVLPGGMLSANGRSVLSRTQDYDSPLSAYGSQQARENKRVLMAHAGTVFSKPGANCEVLKNGYLRLVADR